MKRIFGVLVALFTVFAYYYFSLPTRGRLTGLVEVKEMPTKHFHVFFHDRSARCFKLRWEFALGNHPEDVSEGLEWDAYFASGAPSEIVQAAKSGKVIELDVNYEAPKKEGDPYRITQITHLDAR